MALEDVQLAERLADRGIRDPRVLRAIAQLHRAQFVPPDVSAEAGADTALPIGCDQTISQPYVVAYMTEALALDAGTRVLEIGTGSGYQAAVLLALGCEVFSIERVATLASEARARLIAMGFGPPALWLREGDGTRGWPEAAPFGAIIVTAGAERVPPALVEQLAVGGRLVAPVGPAESQRLLLLTRTAREVNSRWLLPVRFVPLISSEAQ